MEWKASPEPVPYEEALAFMDARVEGIHKGKEPECIWLLEHPPLYTAGTSAKDADLLNPRFPVYKTGRGGEYTYHGPGQRVAYVMLELKKRQKTPDIKKYVWSLEEWIIRSLAPFGIKGERREGRVGIWVETSPHHHSPPHPNPPPNGGREKRRGGSNEAKIAAIGVRVRHWITLHGISINVNPDLSHYEGIVPCGINDFGVTSMKNQGVDAGLADLDGELRRNCGVLIT